LYENFVETKVYIYLTMYNFKLSNKNNI